MSVTVKQAAAKLKSLRELASQVQASIKKAKSNPTLKKQLDKKLADIKSQINKYQKLSQTLTKGANIVKKAAKTGKKVAAKVDKAQQYLDKFKVLFLNKRVEKTLVNFKVSSPRFVWGILSVGATFSQSITLSFAGSVSKNGASMSGHARSKSSLSGDIKLGFSYKKFQASVKGELTGVLSAGTNYKGSLTLSGSNLNGKLSLGVIKGTFGLTAYLYIPGWFVKAWNFVNRKNKIKEKMSKGLGSWELFHIHLPTVSVTFSITAGKFTASKATGVRVTAGKDTKNIANAVRKIILK